jgi:hypothetical protein
MTVDQYSALILVMPQIETLLKQKGEKLPRPNFDGATPTADDDEDEEDGDDPKKSNIEATSDEDE